MKKIFRYLLLAVIAITLAACGVQRTVPITGRTQNLLVSDEEILSLSAEEYSKYMGSTKKSTDAKNTEMVKRVGQNLATAVEQFLTANGLQSELPHYQWEFNLVQDKSVNAFCMPGGKIVVYEGMLPVTQDETSLAIVVGHEIAHAVAKHSAEQMSKQIKQQMGTQILGMVLTQAGAGQNTTQLAQILAQQGLLFRSLKFSREHEYEADRMGLIIAAMAGYDPQKAIPFWQRMAANSANPNMDDRFSDHPSDAKRIAALQEYVKEAMNYYKPKTTTKSATTKKTTTKSSTKK